MASTTFRRYTYAIRVEGIGDVVAAANDKRYRWSWGASQFDDGGAFDSDSLYKTALLRWPSESEARIDPRGGDPTLSALTFQLRTTSDVLTYFWQGEPAPIANLTASLSRTDTSVSLTATGLANGTQVYIGREVCKLGAESPSGTYAILRGQLSTRAEPHDVDGDLEVFSAMWPGALAGRLVDLIKIPLDATAYTDEVLVWRGVLRDVEFAGGVTTLRSDDLMSMVKGTKIYRNPWQIPGGSKAWDLSRYGSPAAGSGVSGTRRALVLAGDQYLVDAAWRRETGAAVGWLVQLDDWATAFGGGIDPPNGFDDCLDLDKREVFTTVRTAPSNVDSPGDNDLPLSQEPGKLILQLLLSSPDGGNDATYDTGIEQIGGEVRADIVDKDAILAWNDTVRHLVTLDNWYLGLDGADPVELYDEVQRILYLCGATLGQSSSGKITVLPLADAATLGLSSAISQSQVLSVEDLTVRRGLYDAIGRIAVKYNRRPGREADLLNATDVIKSARLPRGQSDTFEVDATAITSRAAVRNLAVNYLQRYHAPIIEITLRCLTTADYWPGDLVTLTHDQIPAAGAKGISGGLCLVVGRRESFDDTSHELLLDLWYVGQSIERTGFVAPSARIAAGGVSSTGAGAYDLTMEANAYTTDRSPLTADAEGFESTWSGASAAARLCDQYGAVRDASVTVTGVSGNVVSISGCGVTPVAGDVLRLDTYADCTTESQEQWAFVSDADNLLDGTDAAKEYTS